MKTVNILHITDLHFGSPQDTPLIPVKDKGLSKKFGREISEDDPKNRFLAGITRVLQGITIDAIACSGDLGWKGERNTLTEGIKYLKKWLISQVSG